MPRKSDTHLVLFAAPRVTSPIKEGCSPRPSAFSADREDVPRGPPWIKERSTSRDFADRSFLLLAEFKPGTSRKGLQAFLSCSMLNGIPKWAIFMRAGKHGRYGSILPAPFDTLREGKDRSPTSNCNSRGSRVGNLNLTALETVNV